MSRSALHYFFAVSRSCYHVTSLYFSLAFISVTHCLFLLSRFTHHKASPWSRSICHGLCYVISRHCAGLLPINFSFVTAHVNITAVRYYILVLSRFTHHEASPWSRSICHGLYHLMFRHCTGLLPTESSLVTLCRCLCYVTVLTSRSRLREIS